MIENKLKSANIDKTQSPKQQPVTFKQGAPTNVELTNLNKGNAIVDETNGIYYLKGSKKTLKLTGVMV